MQERFSHRKLFPIKAVEKDKNTMSSHSHTEDQLVEQPAIGSFAQLGWETVSAMDTTN